MEARPHPAKRPRFLAAIESHTCDLKHDELCSSCMTIAFKNIFKPATGQDPVTHHLGQLKSITQRQRTCRFCRFLIQSYEELIQPYLKDISANFTTQSHLFLVSNIESKPWYDAAGIHAPLLPTTYTAWLQIGLIDEYQPRTTQPLVCISWSKAQENSSPKIPFASPRKRILNEASQASINSQLILEWLKICDHSHTDVCESTGNAFKRNFLKTEFVDVRNGRIVPEIGGEPYAALSYVWGLSKTSRASEATVDTLRRPAESHKLLEGLKLLPTHVPQTITDAMNFVSRIGLKFLWVDLYCIDQNDQRAKQDQINSMHLIFECAYLTIVPLDAENMNVGISGISRPLKYTDQPKVDLLFGEFMATFVDAIWDKQGNSPWDQRAWTLQESLLSRRCLYFDSSHFYMLCGEEFFHSILETDESIDRIPTEDSDTWYWQNGFSVNLKTSTYSQTTYGAFVDCFTRRELTLQSDAFNACRAALTSYSISTGVGFTWGIPIKDIAHALLWSSDPANFLSRRPEFPSWSWLGWIGRIAYPYFIEELEGYRLDIGTEISKRTRLGDSKSRFGADSIFRHDVRKSHEAAIQVNLIGNTDETKVLKISSTVARFDVARAVLDPSRHSRKVGVRWTLLDRRGKTLVNEVGENAGNEDMIYFQNINHFCRLSSEASKRVDAQGSQAEFLFIKYWPAIRDQHKYGNWRYDIVSALLITKNTDGTYSREASVTMKCSDWLAANPLPRVIELR